MCHELHVRESNLINSDSRSWGGFMLALNWCEPVLIIGSLSLYPGRFFCLFSDQNETRFGIPEERLCDGISDCLRGEDESRQNCPGRTKNSRCYNSVFTMSTCVPQQESLRAHSWPTSA